MAYQCLLQKYVKHLIRLPRNVKTLAERKAPFISHPDFEFEEDNSETDKRADKGWVRAKKGESESEKTPWNPQKRLTRYQMDHLRALYTQYPEDWTKQKLAKQFGISVTAVCRILRSKFVPSPEVAAKQDERAKAAKQKRQELLHRKLNIK